MNSALTSLLVTTVLWSEQVVMVEDALQPEAAQALTDDFLIPEESVINLGLSESQLLLQNGENV